MSDESTLTSLYEATRKIGLSDSLDQVLDTVLAQAQELIGFDHCALMLYDPEGERLSVRRVRGYGERAEEILGLTLRKGEGLSGWTVAHRRAVRVNDVSRDPRYVAGLRAARSNLAVPLIVANEVAGVINVESEQKVAFSREHEELLTVLGSQAALAILAVRARDRLEQRIGELDALYRISQLAAGQDQLDATLAAILMVTEELIPQGKVAILLRDEPTGTLTVRAARGYAGETLGRRIRPGEGVTGRCAASGRKIVVDDVERDPDYIPGIRNARSAIAVPLVVEKRVIGVLNAEAEAPGAFRDGEARALSVVAHQAAAVIRAAQLNDEARRLAVTDHLTGLHNRRYFVQKLEEILARAARYDERLALVLADADALKTVNDRHGHLTGDRALEALAEVMRGSLRETDEVARIGGDEFAALLVEAGEQRALAVVRRLGESLRGLRFESEKGDPIRLSLSAGVALYPDHGCDARALLRTADQALYEAKRRGREATVVARGEAAGEGCRSKATLAVARLAERVDDRDR